MLTSNSAQLVQDLNQNNDGNDQQNGDNVKHSRTMLAAPSIRQAKTPRPIVPPYAKGKTSNKPPAVKAAVIAKRTHGETKTQIANDLHIARQSVDTILAEANIDEQMTSGLILASGLIPESIRVVKHRLAQNSESAAFGILNPLVLNRVSERPGAKMQGDIHLQQALSIIVKPGETQTVQVVDSKPDTKTT